MNKRENMNDLISIILPIYNGEKYMRESIESVIAQTYRDWELLIIDDCSSDHTAEIAKEYASKDSRVQYFRNEKNLRLPRNLNKGFSLSKGDYLTWTSDDNIYKPEALLTMLEVLKKNPECNFVFCDYEIIDESGNKISEYRIPEDYEDQIVGNNVVGACFMYTREVYDKIGDYQHGRILIEDYDYWQRIFAKFKVLAVHNTLYQYRIHSQSLTGTTDSSIINRAYAEAVLCNKCLYRSLNIAKKYYYYSGLYRCSISNGMNKYRIRYIFYRVIFYYPNRLRKEIYERMGQ